MNTGKGIRQLSEMSDVPLGCFHAILPDSE
jgi:hypothetical protein